MTRASNHIVDSGDLFPLLDMETVDHGQISLPGYWEGGWGLLLIYRANW